MKGPSRDHQGTRVTNAMKKSHAATKHPKMKRHMMSEDKKPDGMMNLIHAQGRTKPAQKPLMNQMGPGLQVPDDKQMTDAKSKAQYTKPAGAKGKMKDMDVSPARSGGASKGPAGPVKMVTPGARKMFAAGKRADMKMHHKGKKK
jgi:hypothetical protein